MAVGSNPKAAIRLTEGLQILADVIWLFEELQKKKKTTVPGISS